MPTSLLRHLGVLALWALSVSHTYATTDQRQIQVDDGSEVPIAVYPGDGDRIFLWIPGEHGVLPAHHVLAAALSERGIESWIADTYTAYFLAVGPSGLNEIPPRTIAELIEAAAQTRKTVYLVSHDQGAALGLRAVRRWQADHPGSTSLGGAILISPYLLEGTPEVGQEARYRSIAAATNLPIYIVQPVRSPLYWRLTELVSELERGGSSVFSQTLEGVRDRYFFRPDSQSEEDRLAERLPGILVTASRLLGTQQRDRIAVALMEQDQSQGTEKTERRLEAYNGDPRPPPLRLRDLDGQSRDLSHYMGKVVLVNFWASWCPPCVHEMPSMQTLNEQMRDRPFEILAVNLGERPKPVRDFLKTQGIDLPVLLDPEGAAIRDWKIFAYPTSFMIDKGGRIRYAVFGAIDWLDPHVIGTVDELLSE